MSDTIDTTVAAVTTQAETLTQDVLPVADDSVVNTTDVVPTETPDTTQEIAAPIELVATPGVIDYPPVEVETKEAATESVQVESTENNSYPLAPTSNPEVVPTPSNEVTAAPTAEIAQTEAAPVETPLNSDIPEEAADNTVIETITTTVSDIKTDIYGNIISEAESFAVKQFHGQV